MSKKIHPSDSYANLVAKEGNRLAQETVEPMVREYVAQGINQLKQSLTLATMSTLADIKTKLGALEKTLIAKGLVAESDILDQVLEVQDAAWGVQKVDGEVQQGDFLRVTHRAKKEDQTEFGLPNTYLVADTGNGGSRLPIEVEKALIGAKTGEARTVIVERVQEDKTVKTTHEVYVNRISRKKETANAQQGSQA